MLRRKLPSEASSCRWMLWALVLCFALSISPVLAAPVSQFALSPPLAYYPGWSVYFSPYWEDLYGDPEKATGAPTGEGIIAGGNPDHVTTLGAFGGSIVLKFDHTVRNDPNNPFEMDAIVYGNAFRSVSSGITGVWMEAGTIEISRDANGDGVANDAWYLIRGSHISGAPSAVWATKQYSKTNPSLPPLADKSFYPDKNSTYGLIWFPTYPDNVTLGAYNLPVSLGGPSTQTPWGYADCSPNLKLGDTDADNLVEDTHISPEEFYTTPDDPTTPGFAPGSGGGDAFDIGWARDAAGNEVNLDGFDFIRITSAVDTLLFGANECSTEVDGVADVSPAPNAISYFKGYPDGTEVRLSNVLVTATYPGEFYVRDSKSSGIKIKSSIPRSVGTRVNVIGSISSGGGERFICSIERGGIIHEAFVRDVWGGIEEVVPIGLPNNLVGGKDLNSFTLGVTGGIGVNNIGMLVRTFGSVESIGANCFVISDGSLPQGGGLKVSPGTLSTQDPRMVIVTGVSSCEMVGNETIRVIRPLQQDGIIEIQ